MDFIPADQLLRDFAHVLRSPQSFDAVVPTDAKAIDIVMEVVHDRRCPRCGGRRWRPVGDRSISCACGDVCVYASSSLSTRRIPPRLLLAAVFAVFVDTQTTTARGFHRRYGVRLATAWQLLHDVRNALPYVVDEGPSLAAPVLGGCQPKNERVVGLAMLGHKRLTVVERAEAGAVEGSPRADAAWWWGRLKQWLNEHFRGVSPTYLARYLAEFAGRHGRVARASAL